MPKQVRMCLLLKVLSINKYVYISCKGFTFQYTVCDDVLVAYHRVVTDFDKHRTERRLLFSPLLRIKARSSKFNTELKVQNSAILTCIKAPTSRYFHIDFYTFHHTFGGTLSVYCLLNSLCRLCCVRG